MDRAKTGYPNKYGKMKIVKKTAISFSSCMFSELPKTAKLKAVRMIVNTKSSELNVEIDHPVRQAVSAAYKPAVAVLL
jgi:predicted metal-binding protein